MPEKVLLALAQLNPTVGDISGNAQKLRGVRKFASEKGAHLVVTTELYLSGYPAEDLVLKPSFLSRVRDELLSLARETADGGPALLVGAPLETDGNTINAMVLLEAGVIKNIVAKIDLPNYGPFDEKRIFSPGRGPTVLDFRGAKIGVCICEDMWTPSVSRDLSKAGAEVILVPNGSPFEADKRTERRRLARARAVETGLPVVYLNQIGGQDELVFDGASFALNGSGQPVLEMAPWHEDIAFASVERLNIGSVVKEFAESHEAGIYQALVLGLRDYLSKNGFPGVVLGLSGGVDSALVAAIAVDAFGPDKVWTVMMPSPFTSSDSLEDSASIAHKLGCRYDMLAINDAMQVFNASLQPFFGSAPRDTTEENIQARSRGLLLMALSNKFGPMVLSTGNKSEMAVGYSTLYGDLCGGFAVIKDVYKTEVYGLCAWRNAHRPADALGPEGVVIPDRVLTKAPTAELRLHQKDQDTLPAYEILDKILFGLIEEDQAVENLVARGFDREIVTRISSMVARAEYKRRQSPPGVKVSRRLLGKDRRYPITNRYSQTV